MSLRAEIHDAINEVAAPNPMLASKVATFVLAEDRKRYEVSVGRGRARWTVTLQVSVRLIAAVLVVLLMVGLVVGGRIWRDRNSSPVHTPHINQAQLKRLEAQPLQFPIVHTGDACPTSPLKDLSAHGPEAVGFGVGPAYLTPGGYEPTPTSWGTWSNFAVEVNTTYVSGPILIRARDLRTNQAVAFAQIPFAVVGAAGDGIPTGKVIGSQAVLGATVQLYPELVIDTSRPYVGTRKGDWPIFKGFFGAPRPTTGCIGFQVDGSQVGGTTFTEILVNRVY